MVVAAVAVVAVAAACSSAPERRKRALVAIQPVVTVALESFAPALVAAL